MLCTQYLANHYVKPSAKSIAKTYTLMFNGIQSQINYNSFDNLSQNRHKKQEEYGFSSGYGGDYESTVYKILTLYMHTHKFMPSHEVMGCRPAKLSKVSVITDSISKCQNGNKVFVQSIEINGSIDNLDKTETYRGLKNRMEGTEECPPDPYYKSYFQKERSKSQIEFFKQLEEKMEERKRMTKASQPML
ncbi:unnamed protein product [Medioppia subpectinata]|uniref:Uncharacterized protein n=1 Tax=Medioppia subpectinata TaxID=1979941 RepID=A0A7R9KJU9_9ACAR|nr:unnamed protein product [Medioppia subpectinata]CAG2103510.1 unnamed protein product [Medioppia subpectinata]